jgi:hypothetical protein
MSCQFVTDKKEKISDIQKKGKSPQNKSNSFYRECVSEISQFNGLTRLCRNEKFTESLKKE